MSRPNGIPHNSYHNNRKAPRIVANGIVALTNIVKPVVTKIYDIAPGGVSFLWANETDIAESTFEMDILMFDIQTNFEFLINQVMGRARSKKIIADPINKAPTWRYSVEFVDLDHAEQKRLENFFTRVRQGKEQVFL